MNYDDLLKKISEIVEQKIQANNKLLREEMGEVFDQKFDEAIEDKIRPLVREEVHASVNLLREDMKAADEKQLDDITDVIHTVIEVVNEAHGELEKRVATLEQHTGIDQKN